MDNQVQKQLADWLSEQTHTPFYLQRVSEVHGGCIHQAYVFESCDRSYFIKMNQAAQRDIFEAEIEALEILARTATIRVPRPIGCGCIGERSLLAMERLSFGSKTGPPPPVHSSREHISQNNSIITNLNNTTKE